MLYLEIFAVVCNLLFLILLMQKSIWCWLFGIVASIVSIFIFIMTNLYAESLLYSYYVIIGIYGWYNWNRESEKKISINEFGLFSHFVAISFSVGFALLMAYIFNEYTDAELPYLDSFTTSFSFMASYLQARKILSSWIYWFVINLASTALYFYKDLNIYALLMLFFALMCIPGYLRWKRDFKA